jgi:hypothetical protein
VRLTPLVILSHEGGLHGTASAAVGKAGSRWEAVTQGEQLRRQTVPLPGGTAGSA